MTRRALLGFTLLAAGCTALFERPLNQKGRAYPCTLGIGEDPADGGNLPDGGEPQCFAGWRCGIETGDDVAVCHERGDERAYVCASTDACEGRWTCGIEGFCIPPVDDAFQPGADEDAGRIVEWASQPLLLHRPKQVIAVEEQTFLAGFHGSSVGFIENDRLTLVVRTRFGPPGIPTIGTFQHDILGAPAPANVKDIGGSLLVADKVIALTGTGAGYFHLQFVMDQGFLPDTPYQEAWPGVQQEHLRIIPHQPPYIVAFGDGGIITELFFPPDPRLFPRDAGGMFGPFFQSFAYPKVGFFFDGGTHDFVRVDDVSAVAQEDFERTALLVSADGILFAAERFRTLDDAGFPRGEFQYVDFRPDGGIAHAPSRVGPITLPVFYPLELLLPQGGRPVPRDAANRWAFGDAGYAVGRVRVSGQRLAIETFRNGTSPSHVLLGQQFFEASPAGTSSEPLPFATVLFAPCQACPQGLQLTDFRPFISSKAGTSQQPIIELRCSGPPGSGVELTFAVSQAVGGAGCGAQPVEPVDNVPGTLFDGVTFDDSTVGQGGWIGNHGQMWLGNSMTEARSLFLDGIPAAVVRGGDEVGAFKDHAVYFNRNGRPLGFIAETGLSEDGINIVASVVGRDDWVVLDQLVVARQSLGGFGASGGEAVAVPSSMIDQGQLGPPFLGAVARSSDGGVALVISSKDALFSADVSTISFDPAAAFGEVGLRHIPVNRVPIRSLAAIDAPKDGGGFYAQGYTLARAQLHDFTATDPDHWRSRELPAPPGDMLEVWSAGDRGRLGFTDGRVYSLPGLKQLAPALNAGVQDYIQFHGQPWAIATNGVWRLRAGADAGMGEWYQDVQVPADGGAISYAGAKFFEANGALYLFTVHGLAVRFR